MPKNNTILGGRGRIFLFLSEFMGYGAKINHGTLYSYTMTYNKKITNQLSSTSKGQPKVKGQI